MKKTILESLNCNWFPHFLVLWDHWFQAWVSRIWAATCQNQQSECAPSKDSDQPGHPPSLIRVFAVRMKKSWVLNYPLSGQRRLWSDWADAQADLSLHWVHTYFVGFVMLRLMSLKLVLGRMKGIPFFQYLSWTNSIKLGLLFSNFVGSPYFIIDPLFISFMRNIILE